MRWLRRVRDLLLGRAGIAPARSEPMPIDLSQEPGFEFDLSGASDPLDPDTVPTPQLVDPAQRHAPPVLDDSRPTLSGAGSKRPSKYPPGRRRP